MAILALLSLLPRPARGDLSDPVRQARNTFEFGDYKRARDLAVDMLENNVVATNEDRAEANRIAGLSIFYLARSAEDRALAEQHFLQLLRIDPDYQLDPFFTTPAAIQFFEDVRKDHAEELEPIRQAIAAARDKPKLGPVQKVGQRTLAVAFLPLGAGQFQNGEAALGWTFATVQVAAVAGSVVTYFVQANLRGNAGGFEDPDAGVAWRNANYACLGVFAAAWITSAAQAWASYQPEVDMGITSAPLPPGRSSLVPSFLPLAGGGLLGLQMGF